MGIFTSDSKKIFKTREEIQKALYRIPTLDYKERPRVYEALVKELDNGGVTREELRRVVRELRKGRVISEIDARNILALAKEEKEEEQEAESGENEQQENVGDESGKEWI